MAGGVDVKVNLVGVKALRDRLKKKQVTDALRQRFSRIWALGVEAFIRAAITRVLVETGMSAATFFPLSRAIAEIQGAAKAAARAEAAIESHIVANQKRAARKGIRTFPEGGTRPGFTNVDTGIRLGEKAFILTTPKSNKRVVFAFSFQTVAFQHAIHEDMQNSLNAGILAFEARIADQFERDARFILGEFFRGRVVRQQGIV